MEILFDQTKSQERIEKMDTFAARAGLMQGNKVDILVPEGEHKVFYNPVVSRIQFGHTDGVYDFNVHGENSYLYRLGIGKRLWNKASPVLRHMALEEMEQKREGDLFFRTYREGEQATVRYVASDKYDVFDNHTALNSIMPLFDNVEFRGGSLTPDRMEIRATYGAPICTQGNHVFYAGIRISNSEVGTAPFQGSLLIFDEVCRNGMIIEKLPVFHQKIIHHVHRRKEGFNFTEIVAKLAEQRDRIRTVIETAYEYEIDFTQGKYVEIFTMDAVKAGLSKKFLEPIVHARKTTLIDVVSDITAASQKLPQTEREAADKFAGSLLLSAA